MKSTQLRGLHPSFSSPYERKGYMEIKCSSMSACSMGTHALRIASRHTVWINKINDSPLVLNRAKLMPLVTECRRRVYTFVQCQSSSSDSLNGNGSLEIFTRKTEQPLDQMKDRLMQNLPLYPSNGTRNRFDTMTYNKCKGQLRVFAALVRSCESKSIGDPNNGSHPSSVRSELVRLALPAIVGQAIDPLAQLMETAYIGRLGPVELASAGVSMSIFNIISKLFNIPLLSITTSFVAEDISKTTRNDLEDDKLMDKHVSFAKAEKLRLPSVSSALLLAAAIGIIEALALFFGATLFLSLMGISPASPMHQPSQIFLSLRALGAPAVVVALAVQGVFRGFKDTKTPLFCVGLGNLSAVLLLPVFVFYFHLGIVGAAMATIASQYITTFLLIWTLSKRAVLLPPKIEDLEFGGYVKSGGLLLGRTLSVLITMTLATSMAARQGPLAMAAHQICLQVWLAVSLLSDALAVSAQALIASSYAKFDYDCVKQITFFVLKAGLFIGIALAVVLGASFANLAELFTKDTGVLQIVKTGVLFVGATQPINALAFIFDGLHYGVSDFAYSAWSMMTVGAISSAFLFYAPSVFGLSGVWSGLTLFMSLRMVAGFLRLNWSTGPWRFLHQEIPKLKVPYGSGPPLSLEEDEVEYDYASTTE